MTEDYEPARDKELDQKAREQVKRSLKDAQSIAHDVFDDPDDSVVIEINQILAHVRMTLEQQTKLLDKSPQKVAAESSEEQEGDVIENVVFGQDNDE